MKTCFIFNPFSGRNRRRPGLAAAIRDFIAAQSLDATFTATDGPGHASALARAAVLAGNEVVVAVGGDGTMNEVAQGLIDSPAALALIPCGSGNGLARHLGLPLSIRGTLELATGRGARQAAVDTGEANGWPFFNVMGLGLDADVSRRFNFMDRRGLPAYARVAFSALRNMRSERCRITSGDRTVTLETLLVAVANSDQYGNNARIAPGARVDDGRLDLVAIKAVGLAGALTLAPRLFLGNLDQSPHVVRLRGRRFVIERPAPGPIHTDGEPHPAGATVEVAVKPRSLRVLIPARSRAVTIAAGESPTRFALQIL